MDMLIEAAENFQDEVLVSFSDGRGAVYSATFLYDHIQEAEPVFIDEEWQSKQAAGEICEGNAQCTSSLSSHLAVERRR
jgi:hypothetical protein